MISFHEVVKKNESAILSAWIEEMIKGIRRADLMTDSELKQQARELLGLFAKAARK